MDYEGRWDGFVIMCDDGVMDEAMMEAAEAWLDKHYPEYAWEFRYPRAGEAEGTYGKDDGRLPQILGCSVPVPEDVEQMISDAFDAAIDAVNGRAEERSTEMTDREVREHLGHGKGTRRVRICRDGRVETYGSTDDFDRDHDWWAYWGERHEAVREINRWA